MEFVNEIESTEKGDSSNNSLVIGHILYKDGDQMFEIKDVRIKDFNTFRDFIYEMIDEWEKSK
jgi:hypothetical protein